MKFLLIYLEKYLAYRHPTLKQANYEPVLVNDFRLRSWMFFVFCFAAIGSIPDCSADD